MPKLTKTQTAKLVADAAAEAYSADRYTSWTACAKVCLDLGFSELEAIEILRSKLTRWAADNFGRYDRVPAKALKAYLEADLARPTSFLRRDVAEWVTEETRERFDAAKLAAAAGF